MTRDIQYALRGFRRAPLAALTIVATVALGLGLVAAVFTLFSAFFYRVDAVRDPGQLFAVQRLHQASGQPVPFTRPQFEMLRRDGAVLTDAAAVRRGIAARMDGRPANGTLVSGNFFQLLGANAAIGRTLTPADDRRGAAQFVIVLSHAGWKRRFARDTAVLCIVPASALAAWLPARRAGRIEPIATLRQE